MHGHGLLSRNSIFSKRNYSMTGRLLSRALRKVNVGFCSGLRPKTLKRHIFLTRPKSTFSERRRLKVVGDFRKIKPGSDYWWISAARPIRAWWPRIRGDLSITTQTLRARMTDAGLRSGSPPSPFPCSCSPRRSGTAIRCCNGTPAAIWRAGTRAISSRAAPPCSVSICIYGEASGFWLNLGIQALATLWILQLTLRVLGLAQPLRLLWHQPRPDPDHGAALARQHAADRHLRRAVGAGAVHPGRCMASRISAIEKFLLFAFTAFAAATHSATLGVLFGLCCVGWIARPLLRAAHRDCRAGAGQPDHRRRRRDAAGGEFRAVWTIGMDARRLRRRLRPDAAGWHRRALPAAIIARSRISSSAPIATNCPPTADDFLWGNSMFDKLGRFDGMNDEMGYIALHSLADYPLWQAEAAIVATARADGARGDRRRQQRLDPAHLRHHRALHPRAGRADARGASAALGYQFHGRQLAPCAGRAGLDACGVRAWSGRAAWRRRLDDVTLLAATVSLALLGNAVICGMISGPHDRYGARMVWIATFTVLIAAIRRFAHDDEPAEDLNAALTGIPARPFCRPCRRPRACGRGWECRAPARPE